MVRILIVFFAFLGLCSFLAVLSNFSNRNLPEEEHSDVLMPLDKSRLLEALHLKATLGERAWPGWGSADVPVIVWNRAYEFLTNYEDEPPAGWYKVEEDTLNGKTYFRRKADDPQNFAVPLGDVWAASMATKQTTDHFLIDTFRDIFPAPIKQVFPYRFLIQPSETQIGGLLHETFHVYQYQHASGHMVKAESMHRLGVEYETQASAFQSDWKKESALLADALKAKSQEEKRDLVRQFLSARDARRKNYQLDDRMVDYERWLEWEEGTAKYMEVKILKQAGDPSIYEALPEMKNDPEFKHYQKVNQRWSQEVFQLRYPMGSGETKFYMAGMAEAFLLDELLPGWKDMYWEEGVFLEDLLRQAMELK